MNLQLKDAVYYLPGRHQRLSDLYGNAVHSLGRDLIGRELLPDFIFYPIERQLALIRRDIRMFLNRGGDKLMARSYGAFLLLQALADMAPFPGGILLFCPVLGPALLEGGGAAVFFRPPRAGKLMKMAGEGVFPAPRYLEIHTGASDVQCPPSAAEAFVMNLPGARLTLVPNAGHDLAAAYVDSVLRRFLSLSLSIREK